jgi:hypothetical protein
LVLQAAAWLILRTLVGLQLVWQLAMFTKKHIVQTLHMEQGMDTDQIIERINL